MHLNAQAELCKRGEHHKYFIGLALEEHTELSVSPQCIYLHVIIFNGHTHHLMDILWLINLAVNSLPKGIGKAFPWFLPL